MEFYKIVELAEQLGIDGLIEEALEDCAGRSDGASGLSQIYALFDRKISCHNVAVAHDLLYERGGTAADRKKADKLLRIGCARSGSATPEWLDYMRANHPKTAIIYFWIPPLRWLWRYAWAWIMYAAVRVFGKRYWGTK